MMKQRICNRMHIFIKYGWIIEHNSCQNIIVFLCAFQCICSIPSFSSYSPEFSEFGHTHPSIHSSVMSSDSGKTNDITLEDIQSAKPVCDALLNNLHELDRIALDHQSACQADPTDTSHNITQPLRGLIGITSVHIQSFFQFPSDIADVDEKEWNQRAKLSLFHNSLPYVIETLPPSLALFKPYLKQTEYQLLCDTIATDLNRLAQIIAELKKNPKFIKKK
jgi:hypothetical protein